MKRVGSQLSYLAKRKLSSLGKKKISKSAKSKRIKVNSVSMGVSTEVTTYEVPDKSFSDKKDYRLVVRKWRLPGFTSSFCILRNPCIHRFQDILPSE